MDTCKLNNTTQIKTKQKNKNNINNIPNKINKCLDNNFNKLTINDSINSVHKNNSFHKKQKDCAFPLKLNDIEILKPINF